VTNGLDEIPEKKVEKLIDRKISKK